MEALWTPHADRVNNAEITRFSNFLAVKVNQSFSSYHDLHRFSVERPDDFWSGLVEFYQVPLRGKLSPVCTDYGFESYGWFPEAKLNFCEALLAKGDKEATALHFIHESGLERKTTYGALRKIVSSLQGGLKNHINAGDVVACFMPNCEATVQTMLATTASGGVFTSTSCDFGVEGVVDRFGQSKPKVLIAASSYQYNGKTHNLMPKLKEIAERLDFLEKVVVVDFLNLGVSDADFNEKFVKWDDFLESSNEIEFTNRSFNDPLYIMYSSGTTGKPKCIVHSTGGTLLQHVKELGLHSDLTAKKSIMYFTTCGWMMWNWLVSSLYFGARVVLYEGSPGFPNLEEFFNIIKKAEINIFGTSPKFLKALEDSGFKNTDDLPQWETLLSTGAPLIAEQYDYIYNNLKKDLCVSSIAGGTDIIGCFMLGNPTLPVYRGEIQCLGLGMDVATFNEAGEPVVEKEGELVCRKSFPSRPLYFLNDEDGERIRSAYFNEFPGVWHHGDFIQITKNGGVMVFGRSDATLNPGGVRIGTAEIYRQTESLKWIEDSLCVGRPVEGDVDIVLFVKLINDQKLTEEKIKEVKTVIRQNTTPRHVPAEVHAVTGIPYTRSGKKMEMAVSRILAKRPLKNIEAVSNPECLEQYKNF